MTYNVFSETLNATQSINFTCAPKQINQAVAVLYARQLLMSLLADWPTAGHVITAELLGCSATDHLPYVLDLLNRSQSLELFSKVCSVF